MKDIKPIGTKKFRENSADSVLFHLEGHTPELPRTLTVTRNLPTPRKGNAGTMKVTFNVRRSFTLPQGTGYKVVPAIVKLETSMPVGLTAGQCIETLNQIMGCVTNDTAYYDTLESIFVLGELPDGQYDDSGYNVGSEPPEYGGI